MPARLHSVIACLLALLYGLVGVTGESLHYLVADLESPGAAHLQNGEDEGYWHCHLPDHHWHHHGGHVHKSVVSQDAKRGANSDWTGIALRLPLGAHSPHACPLLTIVSTLKLGHGHASVIPVGLSACAEFLPKSEHCSPVLLVRRSLARGPPAAHSA